MDLWQSSQTNKVERIDSFSKVHPFVNFIFFFVVILFSMIFLQPIFLGISIIISLAYSIYLNGKKAVRFALIGLLPMFLFAVIFNPLFSHQGNTILFYFPTGNPATLESIIYGLAMGAMLVCVITWFSCFNKVMSSDKITFLFSKITPALALIFTMSLRFVPRFVKQLNEISNARKSIGKGINQGSLMQRFRNGVAIVSILITWALENGIETSLSMRSRGYGLSKRTFFSIYKFETRDFIILSCVLLLSLLMFFASLKGMTSMQFYPTIRMHPNNVLELLVYLAFSLLLSIPLILNIVEDIKWKSIK